MNVRCVCALGGGGGGGGGWNVFFCCGRFLKMLRIGPAPNIFCLFFGVVGGGVFRRRAGVWLSWLLLVVVVVVVVLMVGGRVSARRRGAWLRDWAWTPPL